MTRLSLTTVREISAMSGLIVTSTRSRFPWRKILPIFLSAGIVSACVSRPVVSPVEIPKVPADFPEAEYRALDRAGERVYRISPAQSTVHLYVYRGGRMAKLGHNHVISSQDINGFICLTKIPADSRADLYVPVWTLIVDDEQHRKKAGDDFGSSVSEKDKAGTKRNMLKPESLNGERYPFVRIAATIQDSTVPTPIMSIGLTIRDVTRRMTLPINLETTDNKLTISGTFELAQSDYGITPYSVLGGALKVQDKVKLSFHLVAERSRFTQAGLSSFQP
jgi:hypothetical protein